jgi:HK97 family phage portal protein
MKTTMRNQYVFDGTKSIALSQASEWDWLTPTDEAGDYSNLTPLQAYRLVPYLFRSVDVRARAVSGLPWALYRERDGADVRRDPLYRGLTHGMRLRLYETEAALCLYGASYWLKEANRMGRNLSLRWVLPSSVLPSYDTQYGLVGFERYFGGGKQVLDREDMVYIWQPSLSAEVGPGVAPAQVALAAAGVLYNLDRFADGFFRRGAIKATLLSVEGNPSRAELDRLESWWRRLVSGVRRAWETIAIRSTVKPVVIGDGLKDTVNEVLTQQRREDVCAALGVPHSLISADAANYATSQQDTLNFYQQTVVPQSLLIEEAVNEQVMEPAGLRLQFHPERLEVFQAAEMQKAAAVARLVGQPVLTVDEARQMLGYGPLPKGGGQAAAASMQATTLNGRKVMTI